MKYYVLYKLPLKDMNQIIHILEVHHNHHDTILPTSKAVFHLQTLRFSEMHNYKKVIYHYLMSELSLPSQQYQGY